MTIRDWTANVLRKETDFTIKVKNKYGIVVSRDSMPDGYVSCPEPSQFDPYTRHDLHDALEEMPQLQFVAVTGLDVSNDVYPLADSHQVAIGSLPDLKNALLTEGDMGDYRTSEQRYLERRFSGNAKIHSWTRWGKSAYEFKRRDGLSALRIIFIDHYELTTDGVYSLLEDHGGEATDAIVSSNPNCRGFAPGAYAAARDAATKIMTFREFLDAARSEWK